jgi:hypothetical protein
MKNGGPIATPRRNAGKSPHPALPGTPVAVPAPPKTRTVIARVPCEARFPIHPEQYSTAFTVARKTIKNP